MVFCGQFFRVASVINVALLSFGDQQIPAQSAINYAPEDEEMPVGLRGSFSGKNIYCTSSNNASLKRLADESRQRVRRWSVDSNQPHIKWILRCRPVRFVIFLIILFRNPASCMVDQVLSPTFPEA